MMRPLLRPRRIFYLILLTLLIVLFLGANFKAVNLTNNSALSDISQTGASINANDKAWTSAPYSKVHSLDMIALQCIVDGERSSGCYLINDRPVVPLSLVKSKYEVYGHVDRRWNNLIIHQSNTRIPTVIADRHEAAGRFMFFEQYNVERRPYVKLLTADEGVPLSSQWDPNGYPYPIQIAQFGLSHYTKLLNLKEHILLSRKYVESTKKNFSHLSLDMDLLRPNTFVKHVLSEGASWSSVKGEERDGYRFSEYTLTALELSQPVNLGHLSHGASAMNPDRLTLTIQLEDTNPRWHYFVIQGDKWNPGTYVKLRTLWSPCPPSEAVSEPTHTKRWTNLIYKCTTSPVLQDDPHLSISHDEQTITYWMSNCSSPSDVNGHTSRIRLARDLHSDLHKPMVLKSGMNWNSRSPGMRHNGPNDEGRKCDTSVIVDTVQLYAGESDSESGAVINTLRLGRHYEDTEALLPTESNVQTELLFHELRFLSASDWFLHHQNDLGAWAVPTPRRFRGRPTINAGWSSAMGQGHGISLLVRAFNYTKDAAYLECACKALAIFNRTTRDGGVRSYFFNQPDLPWFEEYPTDPGSFVLNGFIYALVGLYDLAQVRGLSKTKMCAEEAKQLFKAGLHTLSTLLPLFDSGTGTFYDLRHIVAVKDDHRTHGNHEISKASNPLSLGPNRARWDYHSVHIRQLRILASLASEYATQFLDTAARWTAYMSGNRSPHN